MQVQIGFGKYIKQLSHLATNSIRKKKGFNLWLGYYLSWPAVVRCGKKLNMDAGCVSLMCSDECVLGRCGVCVPGLMRYDSRCGFIIL